MATPVTFRANVGVVLCDDEGFVLALERADVPGAWQLPQGGLDQGEEPVDAARRELYEETGVAAADTELVAECPEWLAYELPASMRGRVGRGQVQRWFLFRARPGLVVDLDQAPDREFSAHRWMRLADLAETTVGFRRPIYRRLAQEFAPHV